MRFLGNIVVTGGGSPDANNTNTATPFQVKPPFNYLELRTTGNDVFFEIKPDPAATPADNGASTPPGASSFTTSTTTGFPLTANTPKSQKVGPWGAPSVIACHSAAGATIEVWTGRDVS